MPNFPLNLGKANSREMLLLKEWRGFCCLSILVTTRD
jgi:hypothetical protein